MSFAPLMIRVDLMAESRTADGHRHFRRTVVLGVRPGGLRAATARRGPASAGGVPVGFTAFPGEIWAAPKSWVETVYPGLAYYNAVDRGGHFAAWEEPALFAAELRSVFKR